MSNRLLQGDPIIVRPKEIDEGYKKYYNTYKGNKQNYFALLWLQRAFLLNEQESLEHIEFSPINDSGIDAYYLDKNLNLLYLFQFKRSNNHMLFADSLTTLRDGGLNLLFNNARNQETIQPASAISRLIREISDNKTSIAKIILALVFFGEPIQAEESETLNSLIEDIYLKREMINRFFSTEVAKDIKFEHIFLSSKGTGETHEAPDISKIYSVPLEGSLRLSNGQDELIFTLVSLGLLNEMYDDTGENLFEKNIRSGLGEGKMTNKKIRESLNDILKNLSEKKENFTFYHNGVSLSAESIIEEGGNLLIHVPRILNGAQTIRTIRDYLNKLPLQQLNGYRSLLYYIKVLARIIKSKDNNFLTRITINNNRQNPIYAWNLRAGDDIQNKYADFFRPLNIYYERRENAFNNLTISDKIEMKIIDDRAIKMLELAKVILAMQGKIDKMSRLQTVFEEDELYKQTFREGYLKQEPSKFVLFYKTHIMINTVILHTRTDIKYSYTKKAKNLITALTIQGLMNSALYDKMIAEHGQNLKQAGDYRDFLRRMAIKIRTIFSGTFQKKEYAKYFNEEFNPSFLRKDSTFDDCMNTAKKELRWNDFSRDRVSI